MTTGCPWLATLSHLARQALHGKSFEPPRLTKTRPRRHGCRYNLLNLEAKPQHRYIDTVLSATTGPIIAATHYVRALADQVRSHLPAGRSYTVLGTDGFGRSDTRANLRRFFEVDRYYIACAALSSLAAEGAVKASVVSEALKRYGVDVEKANPMTV